jgi:hypothetical protein
MKYKTKFTPAVLVLFSSLALLTSSDGAQKRTQDALLAGTQNQVQNGVVYVCACLKTKSCFCMTEAKMEGPCACGTKGGPPLKAVPSDSDWAKANREALAK